MAEIIKFGDKPAERREYKKDEKLSLADWAWTCNACGNSTFQLIRGGDIRCASCNLYQAEVAHFNPEVK